MLAGKNIVLAVTGSIAAYKAADLASKLTQAGALVDVVLTPAATQFITPLTFRSLTHRPVLSDMFDPTTELAMEHVALAQRANAVLIAPATANTLAKLAWGLADDMALTTVLATKAPVLVCPAMDAGMWENPATQDNVRRLQERGVIFIGPDKGRLASGLMGYGRLANANNIMGTLGWALGRGGDLAGRHIVVGAGPTQESIDPVRHVTNPSSGKQGYTLAEAARDRGAQVTLVTGPSNLADPPCMDVVRVRTAIQMRQAVGKAVAGCDVLIMTAAVSDYRPAAPSLQKVKKTEGNVTMEMVPNPDILGEVDGPFLKVGFAAESQDLIANATEKLRKKNLVLVAANDITASDAGFAVDTNRILLIHHDGHVEQLPLMSKREVSDAILDKVVALLAERRPAKAPAPA